jgi:hypothetical protein
MLMSLIAIVFIFKSSDFTSSIITNVILAIAASVLIGLLKELTYSTGEKKKEHSSDNRH